jgi:hypothetical protein
LAFAKGGRFSLNPDPELSAGHLRYLRVNLLVLTSNAKIGIRWFSQP